MPPVPEGRDSGQQFAVMFVRPRRHRRHRRAGRFAAGGGVDLRDGRGRRRKAFGILLGVDRLFDMCRTTLDVVTGDPMLATVVARGAADEPGPASSSAGPGATCFQIVAGMAGWGQRSGVWFMSIAGSTCAASVKRGKIGDRPGHRDSTGPRWDNGRPAARRALPNHADAPP